MTREAVLTRKIEVATTRGIEDGAACIDPTGDLYGGLDPDECGRLRRAYGSAHYGVLEARIAQSEASAWVEKASSDDQRRR